MSLTWILVGAAGTWYVNRTLLTIIPIGKPRSIEQDLAAVALGGLAGHLIGQVVKAL